METVKIGMRQETNYEKPSQEYHNTAYQNRDYGGVHVRAGVVYFYFKLLFRATYEIQVLLEAKFAIYFLP
jgi:hypothetical protein